MERISRDTPFCEMPKKMMSLAARQRICIKTDKAGSVVCKINREGICHRNETKKQQNYDNIKYETNLCAYLVPTLSGLDVNDLPHICCYCNSAKLLKQTSTSVQLAVSRGNNFPHR